MAWQYSDGNPPNGGIECRWGRLKSRNQPLSGLAINNCCTLVCISHFAAGFLFTAGIDDQARSTRCCVQCKIDQARSCAIHSHDGRESTARLNVTQKTTEHNRIVRTDKSEAEVTNNKKLLDVFSC